MKINRTSDDKALTGELSISQKILSHVSPQICSTSNKHDNEYLSTSNKLVHECNTVFSDSLFFETENIGENTDKLHISPFKQEIDHKCKSEEAYGNNNQALPQSHSPKTFEPSSQKLSIPKMPYSEKLLSPSSKDIFDIDEKESETGSDKNSSTVQELLTAWSDNDVCVKALDEVCQNRTTVSQEPTLLVSEPNDVGVKNGQNRLDTYSKKEIKSISSTPNTKSTTQITNDSNLSQSYCKIEKWFSINDQVKSAKRILYTLLNCDKCVVCVIFSDAAHFYIQDGTNWKLITKLKRFRADIDNSNTLNSLTLLSYCSDASDCHLCLKSFTVSQEGTMKFIKDYSYYCFFNLESCGDVDFSSSEDEIYGDRGHIAQLKCLRMKENACLLSYFLPSCNRTRQSILLYSGESSHCEHYRLPSINGNVLSYHSFYNVDHCFITTESKQEQQFCYLWHIKLKSAVKLTEERIEARKTLLPSVILELLVTENNQDIPVLLIANQRGLLVFECRNGMLLEKSLGINFDATIGQPKCKLMSKNMITAKLRDCDIEDKLPLICRQSTSKFIIETQNILYLLHCYE